MIARPRDSLVLALALHCALLALCLNTSRRQVGSRGGAHGHTAFSMETVTFSLVHVTMCRDGSEYCIQEIH